MAVVDEIAIKLGIQSSDLKAALKDADASIKQFGKGGENALTPLAKKFADVRQASTALATALGVNVTAIADSVARAITGMSKSEEAAYGQIAQLSGQAADLAIKNMRARLTDEQKLQLLIVERDKIQRALDDATGDSAVAIAEQLRLRVQLETKSGEIQEMERKNAEEYQKTLDENWKKQKEADNTRIEGERALVEAKMETLATTDQIVARQKDLVFYQTSLKFLTDNEELKQRTLAIIAKDRVELVKLEAKAHEEADRKFDEQQKKTLDFNKKAALDAKDLYELELLGMTAVTELDRKRYELLLKQRDAKIIMAEIDELLAKKVTEGLNPAEQKRLNSLISQHEVIKAQIDAETKVVQVALDKARAEGKSTTELEAQLALLNKQKAAYVEIAHKGAGDLTTFTDRQLQEYITNSQKIIDANRRTVEILGYDDPATGQAKLSLKRARAEQNERYFFRSQASSMGLDTALAGKSAFEEDRYRAYVEGVDITKDTNKATNALLTAFNKEFPKSATPKNS